MRNTPPPLAAAVADPPAAPRAALVRLSGAAVLAYCSYAICRTPLLPLFAADLGAGPALIGLVMGASTVTGIFVKLPAGALSDLLGRRRLLLAGALVFAALPFTYLAVASLGLLIFVRAVHGSATAIFGPVASASLSDIAPATRRCAWLATYATAQGAGQALGPLIAGYLIAAGRYDLAFMLAGSIALAAPIIVAGWPETAPAPAHRAPWRAFVNGIRDVTGDRLILWTSGAQAAQFLLHGTLSAFLPLFGRDAVGLSPAQLGWLFTLQIATTLATRPLLGRMSDRVGRRALIFAGLALCGLSVFVLSLVTTMAALVLAILGYAAGVATTTAATSAFITDLTRRARYGAAHGVFGTIYDIGDALGPLAAGLLVAAVGYARMFQIIAMVAVVMAIGFAAATRRRPSRA